ncbi:MAG: YezD family protein [Lachnospiraceae bacterium]|nr:YezD family protein [Lachnospiraceae bacterium]
MKNAKKSHITEEVLNDIKRILETMSFGSVTIIIQDGRVIQIEKNEKFRLK